MVLSDYGNQLETKTYCYIIPRCCRMYEIDVTSHGEFFRGSFFQQFFYLVIASW